MIKEPTGWIWHLNTQKYKNLFSLAKKNRFLYKKITPILMVKIPDFNCVRKFWQNVIVYMYILYASIFVVENTSAKALCISGTIFLPTVTLRQPLKNYSKLRTWSAWIVRTALKYKNLFNLTSKILGSYMQDFTAFQNH